MLDRRNVLQLKLTEAKSVKESLTIAKYGIVSVQTNHPIKSLKQEWNKSIIVPDAKIVYENKSEIF